MPIAAAIVCLQLLDELRQMAETVAANEIECARLAERGERFRLSLDRLSSSTTVTVTDEVGSSLKSLEQLLREIRDLSKIIVNDGKFL